MLSLRGAKRRGNLRLSGKEAVEMTAFEPHFSKEGQGRLSFAACPVPFKFPTCHCERSAAISDLLEKADSSSPSAPQNDSF